MTGKIIADIARRASSIVAYDVPVPLPIARRAFTGESPTANGMEGRTTMLQYSNAYGVNFRSTCITELRSEMHIGELFC